MTGPVQQSPQEIARHRAAVETLSEGKTLESSRPLTLVEKFSASMGGVEPEKMLKILKATAFRLPDKNFNGQWTPQEVTNEQMGALLVVAHAYGLNPFLKEIYAFPDKGGIVPIVGVDGWSRMINDHKDLDGLRFEFDETIESSYEGAKPCPIACTCIIYRKGRTHPTEVTEYLDEVYRPPFKPEKPGPWQTHTKRMLRHKAMIQCARLAFGFTGIHDQDEAERIVVSEYLPADDTPTKSSTLTDRFSTEETAPVDNKDVVDGEIIETKPHQGTTEDDQPEPETKPEPEKKPEPQKAAQKKAPAKKKATKKAADKPKPVEIDYLNKIVSAVTEDEVTNILNDVAELKVGVSQAKKLVIKKAAAARIRAINTPDDEQ